MGRIVKLCPARECKIAVQPCMVGQRVRSIFANRGPSNSPPTTRHVNYGVSIYTIKSTMKFLAVFASLIACATAFAPSSKPAVTSTALAGAVHSMPGKIDFRRKEFFFDPLSLSTTYEPFLPFFREAELRHGRTAMLAVLGMIVPDYFRIPGEAYSFEAIPKTVDAHDALISGPMTQLVLWISLFDTVITSPAVAATMKGEREPGGTFGLESFTTFETF